MVLSPLFIQLTKLKAQFHTIHSNTVFAIVQNLIPIGAKVMENCGMPIGQVQTSFLADLPILVQLLVNGMGYSNKSYSSDTYLSRALGFTKSSRLRLAIFILISFVLFDSSANDLAAQKSSPKHNGSK
ncbi:hypothetical protein BpHYR1_030726 [Brachionus plicatilis]|uniref:Uncharacterized protein n=1 Tax=Brachionus plicatilis TaxID=10195 RepID=A0A3M7RIF5_BRAPC|nr:hypothetical protein BpHYR1_030726 [Brachionus plicatilis]